MKLFHGHSDRLAGPNVLQVNILIWRIVIWMMGIRAVSYCIWASLAAPLTLCHVIPALSWGPVSADVPDLEQCCYPQPGCGQPLVVATRSYRQPAVSTAPEQLPARSTPAHEWPSNTPTTHECHGSIIIARAPPTYRWQPRAVSGRREDGQRDRGADQTDGEDSRLLDAGTQQ